MVDKDKKNEEKEYQCPNCDEDKPEYRETCPECGYADKRIGNRVKTKELRK